MIDNFSLLRFIIHNIFYWFRLIIDPDGFLLHLSRYDNYQVTDVPLQAVWLVVLVGLATIMYRSYHHLNIPDNPMCVWVGLSDLA